MLKYFFTHSTVDCYKHSYMNSLPIAADGQLEVVMIGQVDVQEEESNFTYAAEEDDLSTWLGEPPWDGTPEVRINSPLLALMVVVYVFSSSGIVFALVCMVFNIVFRKRKLVQHPTLIKIDALLVMHDQSFKLRPPSNCLIVANIKSMCSLMKEPTYSSG